MWKETTRHERNLKIFREEFDSFLPSRILDFHIHVFNKEAVPAGEVFLAGGHPITQYEFTELNQDLRDLYPGRQTCGVCFGFPDPKFDRAANDAYIAAHCDRERFFGLRLFDPNERDHDAVRADLERNRFLGIKPYLAYVNKPDKQDIEIRDMVPPWIMEAVNGLGLMIMLHIPRKARLADPLNQRQLIELCRAYPSAKIVLAHIGRAYFLKNIVGYLDDLKDLPNLYYDLAMLNHWEVLEHLFKTVEPHKILYATDMPIALAPGKSVEINDQYTYVTPVPWELSISDDHRRLVFTAFVYEELRAIKHAAIRLRLPDAFLENLFFNNGMTLLK